MRTTPTNCRIVLCVAALTNLMGTASAQVMHQDLKVVPMDPVVDQNFGRSVALEGGVLAIGAPGDSSLGTNAGAAYIFVPVSGQQSMKLTAEDGAPGDMFGACLAMGDGILAIGAPHHRSNGIDCGAVYLFDAASGVLLRELAPSNGSSGDLFGSAIAIDGGLVVVGAPSSDARFQNAGSSYIFDISSGVQLAELVPTEGGPNQSFGISVAAAAGKVAVGSRAYFQLPHGFTLGAAHLFDASNGSAGLVLRSSDGVWTDFFGDTVAMDDQHIAIGAWARSIFRDHSGAVYLFDRQTGEELHRIFPDDGGDKHNFGISLSIDRGFLAIGAHQTNDRGFSSGSAYLYEIETGDFVVKFVADDGSPLDYMGTSVTISNGVVAAGAIGDSDLASHSGSVYLFGNPQICTADMNSDGAVNFFDISLFIDRFIQEDPSADVTRDGVFNIFDVMGFIDLFNAGCP